MKCIGLIGGMSWESTLDYYKYINEAVKARLGGLHSAQVIIHSVDFAEIARLQSLGDWYELTKFMTNAAQSLERAGAQMVLIGANTMHKVFDQVQVEIDIPLVHIADAAGEDIKRKGFSKVALLGTKYTMEEDFYRGRLKTVYDIDVMLPQAEERDLIHKVIYEELCIGNLKEDSKKAYLNIMNRLITEGAQGIIMGCTEIPLLIKQEDCEYPLFDTTRLHSEWAVDMALSDG
ncbi:aspartate/glutamate racemase family protein [Spirochaeta cellobiosiphila]|uniref:aspartate/glutamate racemase family protein n=1 Tax=Spirochaeta cellobiosiphila TaxID=504483 RepID=UPI00040807AC|nr:aspartate/glutamate racemase family protein [Spirochaeta cellobiosiphila]